MSTKDYSKTKDIKSKLFLSDRNCFRVVSWLDIDSVYTCYRGVILIFWFDDNLTTEWEGSPRLKYKGSVGYSNRDRVSVSHVYVKRDLLEFEIFGLFGINLPIVFFLCFRKMGLFSLKLSWVIADLDIEYAF